MSDTMPKGDPLEPKREWPNDTEPMPSELESQLEQIESQDVGGQSGRGPTRPAPHASEDVPQSNQGSAKLPGEDEGPTAEGGGQSLETAGGGGF
jgi:hypothetical protein